PFIALNAGSIPADLLESQLFGHVKGSYTGAHADKDGLFKLAHQGSLFLDEIGNINTEIQAKLLRVIQEKEFMPVGSNKTVSVDVRLICATNADLEKMVAEGQFREDLYYRLNVIQVDLPELRRRTGDLPLLVNHFIGKYEAANGKKIERVDPEFLEALETYRWPGNVRELENLMERA
ncbi:MAG: Fis family transcriptional regulator, partial [Nitrospirae bacterium CG17_big_fil_post_rev_8_21_14_2_50_50_9]